MPFTRTGEEFEDCDEGQDCSCCDEDDDILDWQDYGEDPRMCCLGDACLNACPYHTACECFDEDMAREAMGPMDPEIGPAETRRIP